MKRPYPPSLAACGFSVLEVLVTATIGGIVMFGLVRLGRILSKQQQQANTTGQISLVSRSIVSNLQNAAAWTYTWKTDAANATAFACLRNGTDCSGAGGSVNGLFQADNASGVALTSLSQNGYTASGTQCNSFIAPPAVGDDNCPFHLDLYWSPQCSGGGACINPQIQIIGDWTYNPTAAQQGIAFNKTNYNFRFLQGSNLQVAIAGESRGMVIRNNSAAPDTKVDVKYSQLILQDTSANPFLATGGNYTVDAGIRGAGGLDAGSLATNTWYYLWIISDGMTSTDGLLSTSASAPALPSPYQYQALVAAIPTDSAAHFPGFVQAGRRFSYRNGIMIFSGTVPSTTPIALNPPPPSPSGMSDIRYWLPPMATQAQVVLHCGPATLPTPYFGFCHVRADAATPAIHSWSMMTAAYQYNGNAPTYVGGTTRNVVQGDLPLINSQQLYLSVVPDQGTVATAGIEVAILGFTID